DYVFLPRKAVHSEFYSPVRLDDRLRVATYVGRIGTTSLTLNFDVFRGTGRALIGAGWMGLVGVDRKQLKPRRLPAELVEALAPHTLSLEAARAQLGAPAPAPPPPPPTPPTPAPPRRLRPAPPRAGRPGGGPRRGWGAPPFGRPPTRWRPAAPPPPHPPGG